jgi:hypothetical protein
MRSPSWAACSSWTESAQLCTDRAKAQPVNLGRICAPRARNQRPGEREKPRFPRIQERRAAAVLRGSSRGVHARTRLRRSSLNSYARPDLQYDRAKTETNSYACPDHQTRTSHQLLTRMAPETVMHIQQRNKLDVEGIIEIFAYVLEEINSNAYTPDPVITRITSRIRKMITSDDLKQNNYDRAKSLDRGWSPPVKWEQHRSSSASSRNGLEKLRSCRAACLPGRAGCCG